jgi:transcriptional regulator with XRE-family HTH domain
VHQVAAAHSRRPAPRPNARPRKEAGPDALRPNAKLRQARLSRGLTQADVAGLAGLSRATYQALESGSGVGANPPVRYLTNLAYVFGYGRDIDRLMPDEWYEWTPLDRQGKQPRSAQTEAELQALESRGRIRLAAQRGPGSPAPNRR